jgi:hypothetical protein
MKLREQPGFELTEDGTIIVSIKRAAHHWSSIAQIQVLIESTENPGIYLAPLFDAQCKHTDVRTGENTLPYYREAVFVGANEAYEKFISPEGIKFTLIHALFHSWDSFDLIFKYVGIIAVIGWHQLQSDTGDISYPNLRRLMNQLHEDD